MRLRLIEIISQVHLNFLKISWPGGGKKFHPPVPGGSPSEASAKGQLFARSEPDHQARRAL